MPAPMRIPAGFTQHTPRQPFNLCGFPDPVFYAVIDDDFLHYNSGDYTVTNTGNGTVAASAGIGGQVTFTTNSSIPATTDISAIQTVAAGLSSVAGSKLTFGVRVQLADATNPAFNIGLIQKTSTPFTVTDGIYFSKASGQTYPVLNIVKSSVSQAAVSLNGIIALANSTFIDLAFTYNGADDVEIYANADLFGQGNTATGPVARVTGVSSGSMLTSTLLCPTLAIQSGTASSKTGIFDFFVAAMER